MEKDFLYLAAFKIGTRSLGPGYRSVLWVQGCPFSCKGCIAPDWTKPGGTPYSIEEVVNLVLADPLIEGLTISGGEPMLQAAVLYKLLKILKQSRKEFNVICFTGFLYKNLIQKPPNPIVPKFLEEIDVLIDGPYIEKLNDNIGLRGSANQKIYYLTDKLSQEDFNHMPRKIEISLEEGEAFIIGIPPKHFSPAWDQAMVNVQGVSK